MNFESNFKKFSTDPEAFVLSVRDEEENNFVTEQLRSFSGLATWVWLGVIYDDSGKIFLITGLETKFSKLGAWFLACFSV